MTIRRFPNCKDKLIALWITRAFAPGVARQLLMTSHSYCDHDLALFLGLPSPFDEIKPTQVHQYMDGLQNSLENSKNACLSPRAQNSFDCLAASMRLNATEQRLLEFFACLEIESTLQDMTRETKPKIQSDPIRFLSKILRLNYTEIVKALSSNGRLFHCGLLKKNDHSSNLADIEITSKSLATRLLREIYDPLKVLKSFGILTPPEPELGLENYPHIQPSLDLLIPYLRFVHSKQKAGVNILIYGAPGTGKSQLVRVIGKSLQIPVYELDTTDEDNDPRDSKSRMTSLSLAQTYFRDQSALLVFDEAEDILAPSRYDFGTARSHKGWFNKMLENNRLPVFWISNSIGNLDPAFTRRFDFILEVPIPPRAQRSKILREHAGKLVSPKLIEQLSEIENLAPAVITRARNVVHAIKNEIPHKSRDAALTRVVSATLKAQGHPDITKPTIEVVQAGIYDIEYLNTTANLAQIAGNLKTYPSARLCLYGPPGTGKTSFGHWLAKQLGQPLIVKKASDLLDPYVGGTEEKIANSFEQAKEDGATLLIDEIDSFIRNRADAKRSWEVTQVNEMLTQIESFPGILIASTNLVDQLDPASMRRFDIKLHFGYLLPNQVGRLLASYCKKLQLPAPTDKDLKIAETLETATPGDFAAAARQHRFQPFPSANELLAAIVEESEIKSSRTRKIGFQ